MEEATTTTTLVKLQLTLTPPVIVETTLAVCNMSCTIKNMIEDLGKIPAMPIPLVSISHDILTRVIEYCQHRIEKNPIKPNEDSKQDEWEELFFSTMTAEVLFEIILASNYLDIKCMLDGACKTVSNMIKGKSPEEIRKTFNIVNDFTPEEEQSVRRENEWCEEREEEVVTNDVNENTTSGDGDDDDEIINEYNSNII